MTGDDRFPELDQAMAHGVSEQVFPGGVLLWAVKDTIMYHKGFGVTDLERQALVGPDTVFDLASLTKPLATALAVADLIKRGLTSLHTPLSDIIAETRATPKAFVTVDMLLRHTAGLPAHRRYFERMSGQSRADARTVLRAMLLEEPLESEPGQKECYSDLGYMILSWVVEVLSGLPLDAYVDRWIFTPLNIDALGFVDLGHPVPSWCRGAAATMDCPWRGRVMAAEVEDENAWAAGGVAGHAGLFGNASAVHRLCCEIMGAVNGTGAKVLDSKVLNAFVQRYPGQTRVAGFDTPSGENPAAGHYGSTAVLGHLGFTGTSFWLDPQSGLITILLTNRVHPNRENYKIKEFRPLVHDKVFKAFRRIIPV